MKQIRTAQKNKDVQAPDQKVKGITQIAAEYFTELNFTFYGIMQEHLWQVLEKPSIKHTGRFIYIFLRDSKILIYEAFKAEKRIRGRMIHQGEIKDIQESLITIITTM